MLFQAQNFTRFIYGAATTAIAGVSFILHIFTSIKTCVVNQPFAIFL